MEDGAFTVLVFLAGAFDFTGTLDFTAGFTFFATAFLTSFFRGLILYGFLEVCLELRDRWFKLRIAVELSGRSGMGRNTQEGVLWLTSRAA